MRTIAITYSMHFRKLRHFLESAWLYFFHLLTGRRLEVIFLSKPESVIFANGYFTLHWKTKGCHEVRINNRLVLPGNTSFIKLDPAQLSGSLELRFQGCQQAIIKTYHVSPIYLQTKQLSTILIPETKLPVPEPKWQQGSLQPRGSSTVLLPSIYLPGSLHLRARPDLLSVHTIIKQVQLEPCELPHYNP